MAKIADSSTVAIDSLQLWDRNPRSIKGDRFNELKERLKRQGQIKPLLVAADGRTVIGGNMRLRAMQELGINEVWISQTEAVTDKEIFDLALTDNEEFGYYEQEQVAELALELGLSPIELKSYSLSLGAPTTLDLVVDKFGPEVEEDEVPEVDETETISVEGEVYQLGPHRVMCGSSTSLDDFEKLMDGKKADMVFTDPPYNVEYVGKTKDALTIQNDSMDDTSFYEFLLDAFIAIAAHSKAGASIYVTHADSEGLNFRRAFKDAGFYLAQCLIWNKNVMVMGRQDYHWKHEPILYGWKEGGGHEYYGGRTQVTVWDIDRPSRSEEHPTMKPLALMSKAIKNSSKQEDIIVDAFLGSGSTLIAAEQSGRICYGMELDPKYVDVIRKRYAKHIGEEESWQEATPAVNVLQLAS